MRKIIYILLPILAISCAREAEPEAPHSQEPVRIHTGFTASLPGSSAEVKTTMAMGGDGTGLIVWGTDDPIMVSNGVQMMTMFIEEGGQTTGDLYSNTELFDGNEFYAVYPESAEAGYSEGVFTASIPSVQKFVSGGFDTETFPMIAISDAKRNLAFRNIASLLYVVPTSEDETLKGQPLASISISSAQFITGKVNALYSGAEIETECMGERSVTVSGAGMRFGDPIYVVVAPGQYTNITVRIVLQNGLFFRTTLVNPISVERSKWIRVDVPVRDSYVNLSEKEGANCYMITEPGAYMFDATVRGNGKVPYSCESILESSIEGGMNLNVYHTDGEDFLLEPINYNNGRIFFTTKEELPRGTMLVSLQDAAGKTLWSWHIWANPDIKDVRLSNGQKWLNMNLGALQEEFNEQGFNGYYYQWGRKDPFAQRYFTGASAELTPFVSHASKSDGSLENSILHPEVFYGGYKVNNVEIHDWSTFDDAVKVYDYWNLEYTDDMQTSIPPSKTMFDPCPPGYHVPVYTEYQALLDLDSSEWQGNGSMIDGRLFFPAVSYRFVSLSAGDWKKYAYMSCATPKATGARNSRYVIAPRFGSAGGDMSQRKRSEAVPVRCIKNDDGLPFIPVTGLAVSNQKLDLEIGDTFQLSAIVTPSNASDQADIEWTSSAKEIASVGKDGKVTALKRGETVITVSLFGLSASCTVSVTPKGGGYPGEVEPFDPDTWE